MEKLLIFLFGFLLNALPVFCVADPWATRCHVCRITIHEMEEAIAKVDPKKTADVSSFRLDVDGNSVTKTVKLSKSEMYLTDLMETICKKLEDYAKVTYKKSGKLNVIKMLVNGAMNPDITSYDFIQDGDLNKSLEHYCLEILEDNEEEILKYFMSEKIDNDIDIKICSEKAKYCKDDHFQEDYKLEDEL